MCTIHQINKNFLFQAYELLLFMASARYVNYLLNDDLFACLLCV